MSFSIRNENNRTFIASSKLVEDWNSNYNPEFIKECEEVTKTLNIKDCTNIKEETKVEKKSLDMSDKKTDKVEMVKKFLSDKGIFFNDSFPNGQIQVDRVNLWATSEKWYDPETGARGKGVNAFIKYLKDNNII